MKKTLTILLTVCLIAASLFVSCNNEAKVDERVYVTFGADQARKLSSSASYADFSTLD